jgi:hypothetical protein
MARAGLLPIVLAALAVTSAPTAHAQTFMPLADAAEAQLRACVSKTGPELGRPGAPEVSAPPGLGRGSAVVVTEIPTDRGMLYAYRDRGLAGSEIVCGLAIYGVDPGALAERLVGVVMASPRRLIADPVPHYRLRDARPGRSRYFGDIRAPGLTGVLIFERPVTADAPSLEADFHVVLIP